MTTITFEQYNNILDEFLLLNEESLNEGLMDKFSGFKGQVGKFLLQVKNEIFSISKEFNIGFKDIIKALKNKDIFNLIKSIGFNLKTALKLVNKGSILAHTGFVKLFKELHKSKAFKKIANGTMKIDELLEKYPLLKKVSGPMVAGLLLIVWLNISFIGNADFDFDITSMIKALTGNFNLYELFASPEGMAMLAFVATNIASGGALSVSWLGMTEANFAVALVYTGLKKIGINNTKLKSLIKGKSKIKTFKEWKEYENI